MTFLSPDWLWGLLPWGALALWVMFGRRQREKIPFLRLWDAPEELRRPKEKALEIPPAGVLLILLAMLLGILGTARPARILEQASVSIVVDRGAGMSAIDREKARFVQASRELAGEMKVQGVGEVELVEEPGGVSTRAGQGDWQRIVESWRRTSAPTAEMLRRRAAALARDGHRVIVVSDQELGLEQLGVVQVAPGRPPAATMSELVNWGIVNLAAREGQVMAQVKGDADGPRLLRVSCGGRSVSQTVEARAGQIATVFLGLPLIDQVVEAALEEGDAFDGDDHAWLARRGRGADVEVRTALGDELARMIEVYRRHRAADPGGFKMAIAAPGQLAAGESGLVLETALGSETAASAPVAASDHPVVRGVEWSALAQGSRVAEVGPGEGWTVLVKGAGKPLLAVREQDGVRRAWVGFVSRSFARTADFVVLWTNLLDWLAGGEAEYRWRPLGTAAPSGGRAAPEPLPVDADERWWPGIVQDHLLPIAMNAGEVGLRWEAAPWREPLRELLRNGRSRIELSSWAAAGALLAMLGAGVFWRGRRRDVHEGEADETALGVRTD